MNLIKYTRRGTTVRIRIFSVNINRSRIICAVVHNRDSACVGIGIVIRKFGITEIAARPAVKRCNIAAFNPFFNFLNIQILNGYPVARIAAEEYTKFVRGIALGDGKFGSNRSPLRADDSLVGIRILNFLGAACAVKAVAARNIIALC